MPLFVYKAQNTVKYTVAVDKQQQVNRFLRTRKFTFDRMLFKQPRHQAVFVNKIMCDKYHVLSRALKKGGDDWRWMTSKKCCPLPATFISDVKQVYERKKGGQSKISLLSDIFHAH